MLKRKKINEKAFTLVELLVAISILGVISVIAIPLIKNIKESNENKKYSSYLDSISYAGKLYTDSYSEDLFGYQDSGCQIITYEELKNRLLAKDIQIPDISCATDETLVNVVKLFDKYTYRAKIGCGNKNADGSVTNITKRLEDNRTVNETTEICDPSSRFNMNITATPANGTSVDKKRRKIVANISSVTGINSNISIYYSFSINNSLSGLIASEGWKKAAFTVPTEKKQRDTIFTDNMSVQIKSDQIVTPSVTGSIYLVLRIDELRDLAGVSWSKDIVDETNKYIFLGPYKVDNQKPEFKDSTVISTESGYNSLTPKLNLKATDNNMLSAESDMLACVSVDTDTCKRTASDIKNYAKYTTYKNKVLDKVSTTYNGSTHTIYITVADKAGNYVTKSFSYKVAQKYKITYNSNGGNACSPNNKEVMANQAWGTLCTPTRTGYKFNGWNTKQDGTGDTITSSSKATKNLTVYAQWVTTKVIFKIKIESGDTLTTSTTADDGTKYTWSQNSSNLLMRSVNGATATEYAVKIDRGTNVELDLPNYNNAKYLKITKTGYTAKSGAEWICTNCKTSNLTFSQNKINVNTNNICDASTEDCTVNLKVNWRKNICTINYSPNGGGFSDHTNDTSMTCSYGDSECTSDMRNAKGGYYSATKTGNNIITGKEWINGSTTYNQANGYSTAAFCPNIANGDQTVTLKVNWQKNVCTINYSPNGGTFTSHTNNTTATCSYGEACTDNMRDAQGGYYSATKTGNHPVTGSEWINGTKTYNEASGYNTVDFCPNIANGNQTVTLKVNWEKNKCTIKFSPNGGTFNNNASDTSMTCLYDSTCTSNMRNAQGGYYDATKDGYNIITGKEWINGTKTYNQDNGYDVTSFCPNIADGNQTVTLNVNWRKNPTCQLKTTRSGKNITVALNTTTDGGALSYGMVDKNEKDDDGKVKSTNSKTSLSITNLGSNPSDSTTDKHYIYGYVKDKNGEGYCMASVFLKYMYYWSHESASCGSKKRKYKIEKHGCICTGDTGACQISSGWTKDNFGGNHHSTLTFKSNATCTNRKVSGVSSADCNDWPGDDYFHGITFNDSSSEVVLPSGNNWVYHNSWLDVTGKSDANIKTACNTLCARNIYKETDCTSQSSYDN